ncbi:hypothetical protein [Nitrospira tepida]|uniref:hypothetical protein n=1 Tax=Nitrospira tepida TaxID=2973512 RepID=UPI00259C8369|nr:hypothetical protein [Nitrospira tepida]
MILLALFFIPSLLDPAAHRAKPLFIDAAGEIPLVILLALFFIPSLLDPAAHRAKPLFIDAAGEIPLVILLALFSIPSLLDPAAHRAKPLYTKLRLNRGPLYRRIVIAASGEKPPAIRTF